MQSFSMDKQMQHRLCPISKGGNFANIKAEPGTFWFCSAFRVTGMNDKLILLQVKLCICSLVCLDLNFKLNHRRYYICLIRSSMKSRELINLH